MHFYNSFSADSESALEARNGFEPPGDGEVCRTRDSKLDRDVVLRVSRVTRSALLENKLEGHAHKIEHHLEIGAG